MPTQDLPDTKLFNPLNIKFMTEEEEMKYLISTKNK